MSISLDTMVLFLVALMNALTLYYTHKTEKNTNSMKDELIAATAKASKAEGKDEGLAQARTEDPVKVEIVKVPPMK